MTHTHTYVLSWSSFFSTFTLLSWAHPQSCMEFLLGFKSRLCPCSVKQKGWGPKETPCRWKGSVTPQEVGGSSVRWVDEGVDYWIQWLYSLEHVIPSDGVEGIGKIKFHHSLVRLHVAKKATSSKNGSFRATSDTITQLLGSQKLL